MGLPFPIHTGLMFVCPGAPFSLLSAGCPIHNPSPFLSQAADRGVDGASVGAHTRTTSAEGGGASAEGEGEGGLEAAGEAVLTPNSAATVRREVPP